MAKWWTTCTGSRVAPSLGSTCNNFGSALRRERARRARLPLPTRAANERRRCCAKWRQRRRRLARTGRKTLARHSCSCQPPGSCLQRARCTRALLWPACRRRSLPEAAGNAPRELTRRRQLPTKAAAAATMAARRHRDDGDEPRDAGHEDRAAACLPACLLEVLACLLACLQSACRRARARARAVPSSWPQNGAAHRDGGDGGGGCAYGGGQM